MVEYELDDELISEMYNDGTSITGIARSLGVCRGTIRRRLSRLGCASTNEAYKPWTDHEEAQLIDAVRNGATGFEYTFYVPTRTVYACKGHIRRWKV